MKITTNITNSQCDLQRFADENDIRSFCENNFLDGLEFLPVDGDHLGIVPKDLITGVHLPFASCWVDHWKQNEEGIIKEFGDLKTAEDILGPNKQAFAARIKKQLDFAESIKAQYVVFHISDVSIQETVSYQFNHTDLEVADAAIELINSVLDESNHSFYFLIENLWWPGFSMTNPDVTKYLIDGINYSIKGIMLDTGHLMNTNRRLKSQEEGVEYINSILDKHGHLCGYIKGVHLHQSLSGQYVEKLISNVPSFKGSYYERLMQLYPHVFEIDTHKPFTGKGIGQLIERINPEFLTYEFITASREEHELYLKQQHAAINSILY